MSDVRLRDQLERESHLVSLQAVQQTECSSAALVVSAGDARGLR